MRKLIVIALGLSALLAVLAVPTAAAAAQSGFGKRAWTGAWIWGPATCVRIWSFRSRQTRYGGAPRCRRLPA